LLVKNCFLKDVILFGNIFHLLEQASSGNCNKHNVLQNVVNYQDEMVLLAAMCDTKMVSEKPIQHNNSM
jgi:hypothetical protein